MIVTSTMAGTFVSVVRPTASRATAISLRALFLAPTTGTSPRRRAPPTTRNRSSPTEPYRGSRATADAAGTVRAWPMVNLTRIYTRTGDDGTTSLGDFCRVSKNDLRLHAYADTNEANAAIGVAVACGDLPRRGQRPRSARAERAVRRRRRPVHAAAPQSYEHPPLRVEQPWIDDLEADCDQLPRAGREAALVHPPRRHPGRRPPAPRAHDRAARRALDLGGARRSTATSRPPRARGGRAGSTR